MSANQGYMPRGLKLQTGDETTILLALTEPDLEHAEKKIELLLRERLDEYCSDQDFSGTIFFSLNPELIDPSESNKAKFQAIISRFRDDTRYSGRRTLSGKPLRVVGDIGHPKR